MSCHKYCDILEKRQHGKHIALNDSLHKSFGQFEYESIQI